MAMMIHVMATVMSHIMVHVTRWPHPGVHPPDMRMSIVRIGDGRIPAAACACEAS